MVVDCGWNPSPSRSAAGIDVAKPAMGKPLRMQRTWALLFSSARGLLSCQPPPVALTRHATAVERQLCLYYTPLSISHNTKQTSSYWYLVVTYLAREPHSNAGPANFRSRGTYVTNPCALTPQSGRSLDANKVSRLVGKILRHGLTSDIGMLSLC
jgi:hypothetical protein